MNIKFNISLIFALIQKESVQKYSTSLLGPAWNIILPGVTIFIYYAIFEIGFKIKTENGTPFIIWFLSGYLPFIYFQNCTISISTIFTDYRFLIRKVKFPLNEIIIARLLSSTFIYSLLGVPFICYVVYTNPATVIDIGILLIGSLYALLLAVFIGSFISIATLNISDVANSLPLIFQTIFWSVPIIWSISMLPIEYISAISLNPVFQMIDIFRLGLFGPNHYQALLIKSEIIFLITCAGSVFGIFFITRFVKSKDLL